MKNFLNFRDYLHSELKDKLRELDSERLTNKEKASGFYRLLTVSIVIIILISMIITTILFRNSNEDFWITLLLGSIFSILISCVITMIVMLIYSISIGPDYAYEKEECYAIKYKQTVLPVIIDFFEQNLTYSLEKYIGRIFFLESKLFNKSPTQYTGQDLITGKIGSTDISFSFVKAIKEYNKGFDIIFNGLFYMADFNKNFKGSLFILPDIMRKYFGNWGEMVQERKNDYGELIKLENPEFEKLFSVYGSNQVEARYILSPDLMNRIVDFANKIGKDFYISFVNSKVFIAIPYESNILDPNIDSLPLGYNQLAEYYENMKLFISIVENLNLNTRIWNKQ